MTAAPSKRAVAYIRVSTTDQRDRGVSLEAQAQALTAYCTMRGLELVETIEDAGVSGSVPLAKRADGRRLEAAMKTHGAAHVVALKLDRLFRDAADALVRTKDWDRAGIALHLVDLGGTSIDTSSSMGRLWLTMLSGFAEFERALISERTTTALAHIKARGGRTGGLTYGWRLVDGWELLAEDDPARKRLYPEPTEQEVIRLVHALHAAGKASRAAGFSRRHAKGSLRAICAELSARGIFARNGRPFVSTQIGRMLATPPLAGPEMAMAA